MSLECNDVFAPAVEPAEIIITIAGGGFRKLVEQFIRNARCVHNEFSGEATKSCMFAEDEEIVKPFAVALGIDLDVTDDH